MQLITSKNFNIKTCFIQFLWFFRLKCWFKGQIISRIHLSLPNAHKLMCFDRNINGNRDDKFFDWDYWPKKLTLSNNLVYLNFLALTGPCLELLPKEPDFHFCCSTTVQIVQRHQYERNHAQRFDLPIFSPVDSLLPDFDWTLELSLSD